MSSQRWANGVATRDDKWWPRDKRHLKVRFLNGTSEEKQLVRNLIAEHYNVIPMHIRFKFLSSSDTGHADIRILFTHSGCSSSFIGRWNEDVPAHKHTMELNMNHRNPDKIQADILHEFGHALGLEHEQKHPGCNLRFDRSELKRKYGYDDAFVDRNYGKEAVIGRRTTPYNMSSIMHYPVERGDTMSGRAYVPLNTVLSSGDWDILMELYPASSERKAKPTSTERALVIKPTTTVAKKSREKTKKHTSSDSGKKVYISGSGSNVVQGGYIVKEGSGSLVINGDSKLRISGSGSVILNGNGTVRKEGSGALFVNGDCDVKASGSGSVYVKGSGTAKLSGSGSVYFSGGGSGTVEGSGSIRQYCSF